MGTSSSPRADRGTGRSRRLRWAAAGGSVIGAVALGLLVVNSAAFHVRTIEVTGGSHLGDREIIRLSGLSEDTNVILLNTGEVEMLLEESAWVKRASVERSLPSNVRIEIVELAPVAAVVRGEEFVLVAPDGTGLEVTNDHYGLPLVVGLGSPSTGGISPGALAAAARAMASMEPLLRSQVEQVTVGSEGDLELRLVGGARVLYGPPTDLERKAAALRAVLRWARTQPEPLVAVDVRAPSAPTARLGT